MQSYQNYFQPQMNNGQMMMNPYMDRMAQLQQYQQNLQQPQMPMANQQQIQGVIGRFVGDFSEITANDVPMDGRSAIFPKTDMSEIQVRTWGNDGKIVSTSYKPVISDYDSQSSVSSNSKEKLKISLSDEATEVFMKRFDELEKRLDDFMAKSTAKTTTSRVKKEADA